MVKSTSYPPRQRMAIVCLIPLLFGRFIWQNVGATLPSNADLPLLAREAARDGNEEKLIEVAEIDANALLDTDENGWSPMHEAVRAGKSNIVQVLLRYRHDINHPTKLGRTPLYIAIEFHGRNSDVAKHLISRGGHIGEVKVQESIFQSSQDATLRGDSNGLRELARADLAIIFATDKNGWTLLHEASRLDRLDVVELLVDLGSDVNARTSVGDTPLKIAEEHSQVKVARFLKARGAHVEGDIKERARDALTRGDMAMLRQLGEQDIEVFLVCDRNGWTMLHEAARLGHLEVAKMLVDHGANVNYRANDASTPLFVAKKYHGDDHKLVSYFESLGAEESGPQAKTPQSVAHTAASVGDLDRLLAIADKDGTQLHERDGNDWAPIHEAARGGHLEATKLLVEHGADFNEITAQGESPLALAWKHFGDDHPLVHYFRSLGANEAGIGEDL